MKLISSFLSLILVLLAPGLAPYEAAAQMINPGATGVRVTLPGAGPTLGNPSAPLQIPALGAVITAAPFTPSLRMNAAVVPLPVAVTPAAAAKIAPVIPTALNAARALQNELRTGERSLADQGIALERFWTNRPTVSGASDSNEPPVVPGAGPEKKPDASLQPAKPVSPETNPELFAPRSSRVGISPAKYVYWNALYNIMQWANLRFAKDPNRRVSWDKWPTKLGLLYLIGKIRFLRSGTITDPYDYAANDQKPKGTEPEQAKRGYTADGSWAVDKDNPRMGAENTRFGSNIPPKKVRPDVENMTPSAREVGKLRWRNVDPNTGRDVVTPAIILNDLSGGWIQFQFHNFGGNTKRDPIGQNPHQMPRNASDKWPEKEALLDRTSKDPTRVTDNGRPTPMNERTQAWIQAQIYGTNEEEQKPLRTLTDGKFRLDANGHLPPHPTKPGIDHSGFINNYNPLLSFLHWAFVVNHNNIVDHLKKFHPDWEDAELFDYARKINVASTAQIHTTEWTEDLLQHRTLQEGMHAEYYGLLGPKFKAWVMRASYRHPWFGRLMKPLTNNDVFWGMPGSKWEHHDGPFQVPKHFRFVYRLHEMILSDHEFIEPGTDKTLGRRELIEFIHSNTRPIVEQYGYDVLAYSFVKKSAGALTLKNFPRAMAQFRDQQHDKLMDLAEADTFRERTDGTGSYNEFRRSVGEPPVASFLELTGGDAALAKEISLKYEGDIEKVDAGIGILAEPKPAGFALGFTQFYQFVLNAPRRVKSNRHLTEYFSHKDYTYEGMEWVWHAGGMGGVIARAMKNLPKGKEVIASMEGVTRWFAPWPDTETFPVRLLDQANAQSSAILKATFKLMLIGSFTAFSAWMGVAVSAFTIVPVALAALGLPVLLYYKRMLAYRYMQKTWQSVYTDRRRSMFPTLFLGEKVARWAGAAGKFAATGAAAFAGYAAFTLFATNPVVALMAGVTALMALGVVSKTKAYENNMAILKIALQNRIREGYPVATVESVGYEAKSDLERRYWFLVPAGAKQPVATVWHSYRVLHEHGLGRVAAFKTALLSHLVFGPRTQRGLGLKGRWKAGTLFSPFAIYVPNMIQAQGPSSTGIYAHVGNDKGLAPGNVDEKAFDEMFSRYAPGRDYMTAYDFARMREDKRWRDSQAGIGGPVSRWLGEIAVKKRTDQLLQLYADTIANEDKHLNPAISRGMMLRVYKGTAQADIAAERALDGVHPDLRAANPEGRLTLKEKAKSDIKKLFGAVRTLAGSLVLPYTGARLVSNFRAFGTFFKTVYKLGWIAIAAVLVYYLIRDSILYILIPYLLYKGFLG